MINKWINPFLGHRGCICLRTVRCEIPAFYDGQNCYLLRFMAKKSGVWKYEVNGKSGEFIREDTFGDNHW